MRWFKILTKIKANKQYRYLKEYPQRKNWTFSKLRKGNAMLRFFRNLFTIKCPKCKKGKVKYMGDDWNDSHYINVYECSKCKLEFI